MNDTAAPRWAGALRAVTRRVDELISPSRFSGALLGRHHARRREIASTDARWREIEDRRGRGGRQRARALLSHEHGLGLADLNEQFDIAERLAPDPWWVPLARRANGWRLEYALDAAETALGRARRGWAPSDAVNLGRHLALVCAGMLEHLADTGHGWPDTEEFPTPEDWQAQLRQVAAELRRVDVDAASAAALDAWFDLACTRDVDPGELAAARRELDRTEADRNDAVVEAMGWVAVHIHQLWD